MSEPIPFRDYAKFYDLLYRDKDYDREARFVLDRLEAHAPRPATIVDFGCGTGRHARAIAALGVSVTGVERSLDMLETARATPSATGAAPIEYVQGDIRFVAPARLADAAVCLFHVLCYLTHDEDLDAFFQTVAAHLPVGGVLLFDVWHGPAVLRDRPAVSTKHVSSDAFDVTRIGEPHLDADQHIVEMAYRLTATDRQSGAVTEIRERHRMRFFFLPDLAQRLSMHHFTVVETGAWLTGGQPDDQCWSAYVVARRDR
mgnify:CR=1 FL=1